MWRYDVNWGVISSLIWVKRNMHCWAYYAKARRLLGKKNLINGVLIANAWRLYLYQKHNSSWLKKSGNFIILIHISPSLRGGGLLGEGTCWYSKLPVWRFFLILTGSNKSLNGSCMIHYTLPSFWVRNGHFGHNNGFFSDHIFSRSTYWRFQSCETGCSVCNLQKKIKERSLQKMPFIFSG